MSRGMCTRAWLMQRGSWDWSEVAEAEVNMATELETCRLHMALNDCQSCCLDHGAGRAAVRALQTTLC